ncbi:hypothetical protein VCR3J2_350217 [Vibrio coralliirubri]|nr:hypothetical protein VCR3J2_350217 [Vibrio coralliirubri]
MLLAIMLTIDSDILGNTRINVSLYSKHSTLLYFIALCLLALVDKRALSINEYAQSHNCFIQRTGSLKEVKLTKYKFYTEFVHRTVFTGSYYAVYF